SRIFTFLEDSIVEVEPPHRAGSFHSKVWAVRFAAEGLAPHHRFIITSRNLTTDSSWDTILVLDEVPDGPIGGQPAADLIGRLPEMATRPMNEVRADSIRDLAASLATVRFAVPAPYTGGDLLPLGIGANTWPVSKE